MSICVCVIIDLLSPFQDSSFVYSESEMIYPKEINHDVLFREGHNLKVHSEHAGQFNCTALITKQLV